MSENDVPPVHERLIEARGEEIRMAREARGWSQAELAKNARTSQQTVDRLERGVVMHSRAYPTIRKVLGMDMRGYDSWPLPEEPTEEDEPLPGLSPALQRESEAMDLLQAGRVPVFALVNDKMRLVDAIPRVFPYEFAQGANALLITDSLMEPVLRKGDIAVVHPNIPAQIGNEVAYAKNELFYVRTLVDEDDEHWIVQSWNPVEKVRISKKSLDNSVDVVVTRIMKSR